MMKKVKNENKKVNKTLLQGNSSQAGSRYRRATQKKVTGGWNPQGWAYFIPYTYYCIIAVLTLIKLLKKADTLKFYEIHIIILALLF